MSVARTRGLETSAPWTVWGVSMEYSEWERSDREEKGRANPGEAPPSTVA